MKRRVPTGLLCLSLALAAPLMEGCRVSEDDIHLWARKKAGPKKLSAVLSHDKYALHLRVEAAMAMATMKPRGGRAVGLLGSDDSPGLLAALRALPAKKREQIAMGMVAPLVAGMQKPRTEGAPDESIPYKDTAYGLLTDGGPGLLTDPAARQALEAALIQWCRADFEARIDDASQIYGLEQVLRRLGPASVRRLPELLTADFKHMAQVAKLVHELGDEPTQLEASKRLVAMAQFVDSPDWRKKKQAAVEAANKKSGLNVTPKQLEKQLEAYQEEELLRVFSAMKSVGKAPAATALIAYAKNDKNVEKRRAAALAALEGNLDRKNAEHAKVVLDFLSDDKAPDAIRDVAARRVGELSREQVAGRLYDLFSKDRWQVRWTAASLLLKMSEAKDLPEFMERLGKVTTMALTEPLSVGALLHDVKGESPETVVARYSAPEQPVPVRLTALGYYHRFGDQRDAPLVERFVKDPAKVPVCPKDAEGCEWRCTVTEPDPKTGKPEQQVKEISTVGDFVAYCILPELRARAPESAAPGAPGVPAPTPPAPAPK